MISVIIPVFNREKTISRCIDSVLNQTYQDIEIIIVNDGSNDRTGDLCCKYNDARIIYENQKNQGVSSARNRGMELAHGKYMAFVDSDDYVESFYLESLLNEIGDSDLCLGGWIAGDHPVCLKDQAIYIHQADKDHMMQHLFQRGALNTVWGKLFIRDVVAKNNITFSKELMNGEDLDFVCQYLLHSQTIQMVSQCGYHYTQDAVNAITSSAKRSYLNDFLLLHKRQALWNHNRGFLYSMYARYRSDIERSLEKYQFSGTAGKEEWDKIKTILKEEMVVLAFSCYQPVSSADWLVHQLMKRGYLRLLSFVLRMRKL